MSDPTGTGRVDRGLTAPKQRVACGLPPPGWICTRDGGHDGPCAAIPIFERAYIHAHSAVCCPTCDGLMKNSEAPVANDKYQVIECFNPKCPEVGKRKRYARPYVELLRADSLTGLKPQ